MSNSKITIAPETRVVRDETGHIRSIFEFGGVPPEESLFDPEEVATRILDKNEDLFEWPTPDSELKQTSLHDSTEAHSVGFTQEFKGVLVDSSDVTVNITKDGQPYAVYNNYHYEIPDELDPGTVQIDEQQVRERIAAYFGERYQFHKIMEDPRLMIYRHRVEPAEPEGYMPKSLPSKPEGLELMGEEEAYYVTWEVLVATTGPSNAWRALIEASTGEYMDVQDMFQYYDGSGKVFDPDPITTSGDTSFTILGSSPTSDSTLNGQQKKVKLKDFKPKDKKGKYHLDGSYVRMEELENPKVSEPTDSAGKFEFSRANDAFKDTMTYYHIDRFQRYLQQLGFSNLLKFDIAVDAHGFNGTDNSHYYNKYLSFGAVTISGSKHVADAEDAGVILHEYGHAIQDNQNPGFVNPVSGVGEGFCDTLAAVFFHDRHAKLAKTVGMTFPWDGHSGQNNYTARRYDRVWKFGGPEATGKYTKGELWASVMFEIYRKLGGDSSWLGDKNTARDLTIKLHLDANPNVPKSGATATQMAQEIEKASKNLKGWHGHKSGLHTKVIYDAFHFRDLKGFKEKLTPTSKVDVYIDDGRKGKYDWLQSPWHPKDIWTRLKKDGKEGHQKPFQNKPAYLYVKIRNLGTEKAKKVTVKAYHSAPAVGLVWPTHFKAMKPITITDLLPDSQNPKGTIVGPFEWTPTASSGGCVLVVLECDQDKALTQTQTTIKQGPVNTVNLVRYDNNIAQRNLSPVKNTGSPKQGFFFANPDEEVRTIDLEVTSTLPDDWEVSYSLPEIRGIRMAPFERRWVEFEVMIPPESETVDLENPPMLSFEGLIEGRSIGGIDFYFAPPETFGWQEEGIPPVEVCPRDLFGLQIPWDECDIEGTLELKLKFSKKK